MSPPDPPPRLVVAVLTYRRPHRLARLLRALPARLAEVPLATSVLVVDNDPAGSARKTVQDAAVAGLRYVVEPEPGIAAARASALAEASSYDLLAFLDDDEVPLPGWLSALVSTWESTRAAAVMGRVVTVFPDGTDPWVLASGLFRRPRMPTGTRLDVAATNNLLLDLRQVRDLGVRFDARLGLSGGEDTLFSRTLHRRGGSIVWCDESVAEDHVEPDRTTREFALLRARSHGQALVRSRREVATPGATPLVLGSALAGGLARVVLGMGRHLFGRVTHRLSDDARGLRIAARGRGMVAAVFGRTLEEYQRSSALGTASPAGGPAPPTGGPPGGPAGGVVADADDDTP